MTSRLQRPCPCSDRVTALETLVQDIARRLDIIQGTLDVLPAPVPVPSTPMPSTPMPTTPVPACIALQLRNTSAFASELNHISAERGEEREGTLDNLDPLREFYSGVVASDDHDPLQDFCAAAAPLQDVVHQTYQAPEEVGVEVTEAEQVQVEEGVVSSSEAEGELTRISLREGRVFELDSRRTDHMTQLRVLKVSEIRELANIVECEVPQGATKSALLSTLNTFLLNRAA